MSKDGSFEMVVLEDGSVEALYADDRAELFAEIGETRRVCRLSNVEWEGAGWTVRSAADPRLALRRWLDGVEPVVSRDEALPVQTWARREDALAAEVENAWDLRVREEGS